MVKGEEAYSQHNGNCYSYAAVIRSAQFVSAVFLVTSLEKDVAPAEPAPIAIEVQLPPEKGRYHVYVSARTEQGGWFYEMVALGYNYRLTDIGSVLGLSQLQRLDENLARRREIAAHYTAVFSEIEGLVTPQVRENVEPAWHLYPIQVQSEKLKAIGC